MGRRICVLRDTVFFIHPCGYKAVESRIEFGQGGEQPLANSEGGWARRRANDLYAMYESSEYRKTTRLFLIILIVNFTLQR